ncbi:hypothetical protein CH375_18835 [Leptospira ellisii]|uniref:Uncharacterized protein n=1 Tax=Leptospira ellisii TaxID=2023197 RepID=A0A2N0B4S5_9LEPT|nr:hypothetical protein CH379_18075 [Leptospira ellisii]PKA03127.1 hypothetical protein CH375_18835 [Leptospira ellisii]
MLGRNILAVSLKTFASFEARYRSVLRIFSFPKVKSAPEFPKKTSVSTFGVLEILNRPKNRSRTF